MSRDAVYVRRDREAQLSKPTQVDVSTAASVSISASRLASASVSKPVESGVSAVKDSCQGSFDGGSEATTTK